MLQFHEVRSPHPLIWSAIALPTRPTNSPTIGPKANPKNVTRAKPGRSELDGQRQAVEAAAQLRDRELVRCAELELARCRGRSLHEQHDRLVLPQPGVDRAGYR